MRHAKLSPMEKPGPMPGSRKRSDGRGPAAPLATPCTKILLPRQCLVTGSSAATALLADSPPAQLKRSGSLALKKELKNSFVR